MQIPTSEQMFDQLETQLYSMNNALSLARINLSILEDLVPDVEVRGLAIGDCISGVSKSYFTDLCKRLTKAYAQGTLAKIELDESKFALDRALEAKLDKADHGETQQRATIIDEFISLIPFKYIHASLTGQANSLVDNGKSLFADEIVNYLNLKYQANNAKVKSGLIILEMYTTDYWDRHNFMPNIIGFKNALRAISMETNADFGFSVVELKNAVDALSYQQQKIVSRTTFGKSTDLEIVCFKTKYEFRFSRSVFDALTAFVPLHGSDKSIGIVNAFIDTVCNSQAA